MRTIVLVAVVYFCLAGSKTSLFYQGWERIFLTSMGYFGFVEVESFKKALGGFYPLKFLKSLCSANNEFS